MMKTHDSEKQIRGHALPLFGQTIQRLIITPVEGCADGVDGVGGGSIEVATGFSGRFASIRRRINEMEKKSDYNKQIHERNTKGQRSLLENREPHNDHQCIAYFFPFCN